MKQLRILLISGLALLSFGILSIEEENSNKKLSVATIKEQPDTFEILPDEILVKIIRQLIYSARTPQDLNDISSLGKVSKRFLSIINDPYIQRDYKLARRFVRWYQEDQKKIPGAPPAMTAINHGGTEWYKGYLEQFPAQAHAAERSGITFLALALSKENSSIARLLRKYGAKVTFYDLAEAIRAGRPDLVKSLLETQAPLIGETIVPLMSGSTYYATERKKVSALYFALQQQVQDPEIFKLLFKYGATLTPDEKNKEEQLLLQAQSPQIAKMLIQHGIGKSYFALANAIAKGNVAVVQLLINNGLDVNHSEEETRFTPLLYAIAVYDPVEGMYIREEGRPPKFTPQAEIISLLLNACADIDAKDYQGISPRTMAQKKGDKELIKVLETLHNLCPITRGTLKTKSK